MYQEKKGGWGKKKRLVIMVYGKWVKLDVDEMVRGRQKTK
jgi:hypothetical protein